MQAWSLGNWTMEGGHEAHKGLSTLVRVLCMAALSLGLTWATVTGGASAKARAAGFENLMVPSASMGRDIPVAFLAGGPHAVYLLDAFNAAPDVSNWVTAGNGINTLAGKGISVVAPAGGAYSMYTNWEQDGSKQWDTFLSQRAAGLAGRQQGPGARRARRRRRLPGRVRRDGAGHVSPRPVPLRRLAVGLPVPSNTTTNGAILAGMQQFGGVDANGMWGAAAAGPVEMARPRGARQLLVAEQHPDLGLQPARAWRQRPRGDDRLRRTQAKGNARTFYQQYRSVGGHNGHFDFPSGGNNDWGSWCGQLGAMSGDIVGALR